MIGDQRHILYRVYPIAGNGIWQRNVDLLIPRIGLFNGRRIVAIATYGGSPGEPRLDLPQTVMDYMAGLKCEFSTAPNDPKLREVTTFVPMLERMAEFTGPEDVTFFGHTKGVTRAGHRTSHRWTKLCYEINLDYWPIVRTELQSFPAVGAFKRIGPLTGSSARWHYSGSFWWVRNADLFRRDWRKIDQNGWGTESYVGLQFRDTEGQSLFLEGTDKTLDLYNSDIFDHFVEPEAVKWKSTNSEYRTAIG